MASMASFNRPRFSGPIFKHNAPRHGYNMNFRGERPPMQSFQRVPGPSYSPFQPPDRFPVGNFQNRPPFSKFPDPTFSATFRSRPPIPDKMSAVNAPHPGIRRFGGPFQPPSFRPWNQRPAFSPPRPHFQNRPRPPVPPLKSRNAPPQANKKRKQKAREFKKFKDNNKEKPFSCDTCDRAFVTQKELEEHISEHVKCEMLNCKFEAHPKIVALHQKMQHETGYADVISKLHNTEDIQKWREERKKNFPTAENIQKRKAEQAEKEARGEILETKEFGKFQRRRPEGGSLRSNDNRRKRTRLNNHPIRENHHNHPSVRPFVFHIDSESDSDSDSHITLKPFAGMSSLTNSPNVIKKNSSIETGSSSWFVDITNTSHPSSWNLNEHNLPSSKKDLTVQNVLETDSSSSNVKDLDDTLILSNNSMERKAFEKITDQLVAVEKITAMKDCQTSEELMKSPVRDLAVADMEGSDDEAPTALPIIRSTGNDIPEEYKSHLDKMKKTDKSVKKDERSSNSSGLNEASSATNIRNRNPMNQSVNRDSSRKYTNSQNNQSYKRPESALNNTKKDTLLEKLLAPEIRHERNVILQCVRYIVNNNFFGVGE